MKLSSWWHDENDAITLAIMEKAGINKMTNNIHLQHYSSVCTDLWKDLDQEKKDCFYNLVDQINKGTCTVKEKAKYVTSYCYNNITCNVDHCKADVETKCIMVNWVSRWSYWRKKWKWSPWYWVGEWLRMDYSMLHHKFLFTLVIELTLKDL